MINSIIYVCFLYDFLGVMGVHGLAKAKRVVRSMSDFYVATWSNHSPQKANF